MGDFQKFSGPIKVRFGAGATINLGNYQSARYDVAIELPCSAEQVTDAFEAARAWVDAQLQEEVAKTVPSPTLLTEARAESTDDVAASIFGESK